MESVPEPPNPFAAEAAPDAIAIPSLTELFFLPGDWALYALAKYAAPVADVLGVGSADYGRTAAAFLALLGWFALAIALIMAVATVRRFDRALTRGIVSLSMEFRRRVRMAVVLVRYRRSVRVRRREKAFELGEEPELCHDELRVLSLHGKLAPGFALTVSDVAAELRTRGYEIRSAFERLHRLELLRSTVGGFDGESAYTLTQAGRALLTSRERNAAARRH